MKNVIAGVCLSVLSLTACAQDEVHLFNDFDEAAEFVYETLHDEICGTAASAIRNALKLHGIPDDIQFASGGWMMEWHKQTGIMYMTMFSQSRDPSYEICVSRFVFQPY